MRRRLLFGNRYGPDEPGGVEVLGQLVDVVGVADRRVVAPDLVVGPVGHRIGGRGGGLVGGHVVGHGACDGSDRRAGRGNHRRGRALRHAGHASRSLVHDSSRGSGSTRVSATDVMKFESAFQRGSTWTCRWEGMPAPAASPRFSPTLTPWGR